MKTRLLLVALLGMLVAGLGIYLWPNPPAQPAVTEQRSPLRVDPLFTYGFGQGWRYRYSFELHQESVTQVFAGLPDNGVQTIEGEAQLAGELMITAPENLDQPGLTRWQFAKLNQHSLKVADHQLFTEEVLSGREAAAVLVQMDSRGKVLAIQGEDNSHELYTRLVHLLLSEWQIDVEAGSASWESLEQNQHGEVLSRYSVETSDNALGLSRQRQQYRALYALGKMQPQLLQSLGRYRLHALGYPIEIEVTETLRVPEQGAAQLSSNLTTKMKLMERQPLTSRHVSYKITDGQQLMQFADPQQLEENHLRQRVEGMTAQQLMTALRKASSGQVPDHNRWLWRATGLLTQQPDLAAAVADHALDPQIGHKARCLALDLLVGAGTEAAQMALLRALSSPVLIKHSRYGLYLQRLSLLKHPNDEVIAHLQQSLQQTTGLQKAAAYNALGAVADHRRQDGDRRSAQQIADQLAQALADEQDPAQQAHLIEAIGNAGQPSQAPLLRPYMASGSAQVRYAVASALRKMDTPIATGMLLDLCADSEANVVNRSLESLGRRDLSDSAFSHLQDLVHSQSLPSPSYHALVSLLHPLLPQPQAAAILQLILQQPGLDSSVKTRVRGLLEA